MESLGDAARRLLAGLEQDARTKDEKSPERSRKGSAKFKDQPGNVVPLFPAEKGGVPERFKKRSAALDGTPQLTVAAWEESGGNGLEMGGRVYSLFEYSRNTSPDPEEAAMGRSRYNALRVWE